MTVKNKEEYKYPVEVVGCFICAVCLSVSTHLAVSSYPSTLQDIIPVLILYIVSSIYAWLFATKAVYRAKILMDRKSFKSLSWFDSEYWYSVFLSLSSSQQLK